jgi:hypothetical protein
MEAQTQVRKLIGHGGRLAAGLAFAVALLLTPATAAALDYPVNNTNDAGAESLRQAIIDANANGGADTITINTTGTLTLASALPVVGGGTTITGPGQSQFTINGADTYQVLKVTSGAVSISGLTITHGNCDSTNAGTCGFTGGGLLNTNGTVTLTDVAVTSSNTAGQGGGIYNGGTMNLSGSAVSSNMSAQSGDTNAFPEAGGIFNNGTLTLTMSTVSGNSAIATGATGQNAPEGGGIFNNSGGTLNLDRSTVDSNNATADAQAGGGTTNAIGGGIINDGTLDVTRSTVSNNTSSAINGTTNTAVEAGIANGAAADVTIDRSTISDNTATASDFSQVGGMEVDGTSITITSSTIAHNSAAVAANLRLLHASTMKNTIVSDPQGGGNDCGGATFPTSQGYNIDEDASCGLSDPTDQSADPMLDPSLANNGGPTRTYALQTGSPAIDKGKASVGETVDQRGDARPSDFGNIPNAPGGDGSDIGAFELQDTTPPNTLINSGPSGTITDPTPTFTFHSTEMGSTFQCKIDAHSFVACTSPRTLAHLGDGSHTFQVRAKDLAGNLDPSPASRSFTVKTAEIKRSGSTLMITAALGAKDNLLIKKVSATQIQVTDLPAGAYTGSGIHTGPGCSRSGDYTANCTASPITAINVVAGAGKDRVHNMTALPSTINGGSGDDALIGGAVGDQLTGGPGADLFQGGNGNDTLLARDLTSDSVINCDGGSKPGGSDEALLDKLPKDSSVSGC